VISLGPSPFAIAVASPCPYAVALAAAPSPDRRRALELLASLHMVELVRAGLATATAERVVAGSRKIEVARVRITAAGRRALAQCRA
jgi:hypothetical protein